VRLIEQREDEAVSIVAACASLGVSRASLYRRRRSPRPPAIERVRAPSARRLDDVERQRILDTLHLPDSIADADGVLIEPAACVVKSLKRSGLKAGESILIIGLGIMGMMHVKLARHLGAWCIGQCMGLFLHFLGRPSPRSRSADIADHGLPTIGNVDMLDRHLLLALRTIVLEGRDLSGERARELVEGVLSALLLRDNVNVGEAPSEGHRRVVDRGHLSRQHRLDLIPWLDPLDDGEHEICPLFRSAFSFAGAGVYEMPHQAIEEV